MESRHATSAEEKGREGDWRERAERYPSIGEYALLSDCHGAALVSMDGSVDWACLLRVDAPPIFARLVDWDRGGHFRIAPVEPYRVTRRYVPDTMVLETRFETETGAVVMTDLLVMKAEGEDGAAQGKEPAGEDIPQTASGGPPEGVSVPDPREPLPRQQLLRRLECAGGSVRLRVEFRPRFNFGQTTPRVRRDRNDAHIALAWGGSDALSLQSPGSLEVDDHEIECELELGDGETRWFALSTVEPHTLDPMNPDIDPLSDDEMERRYEETLEFWRGWAEELDYDGPYDEAVRRSALVLQGLRYVPSGAVLAAPTTSLPETVGGERNWDYRYSWIRDAAFAMDALMKLGYRREADLWIHWLQRATAGLPADLQPMYAVDGARVLEEIDLHDIEGYRGSTPVRIGNGAYRQFQLDVPGEFIEAVWEFCRNGGEIEQPLWEFMLAVADFVTDNWQRPDSGIWETRAGARNFTHSIVSCWVALDRVIRMIEDVGLEIPEDADADVDVEEWKRVRERIRERVESGGLDPDARRYKRSFGDDVPDAANLLIPLLQYIPHDDERATNTREWIRDELAVDDERMLLRRYRVDDGLPGEEGCFIACSFWLAENLARAGEVEEARRVFEKTWSYANDLGLMSEEIDPDTGELIGNFPQALSHIGLIAAAVAIAES